jgi:hypothetical protein
MFNIVLHCGQKQFPDFWINAAGEPYKGDGPADSLFNDITGRSKQDTLSVIIIREQQHHLNMSGGKEIFVPKRFLFGVIPQAVQDAYRFWQDESVAPRFSAPEEFARASLGYKRLIGYPKSPDTEFMIVLEFQCIGDWMDSSLRSGSLGNVNNPFVAQATGLPGRVVSVTRIPKDAFEKEFHQRQRVARVLEATQLLVTDIKVMKEPEGDKPKTEDPDQFKVDQEVECDYEGKGTYWPCTVRYTYCDLTFHCNKCTFNGFFLGGSMIMVLTMWSMLKTTNGLASKKASTVKYFKSVVTTKRRRTVKVYGTGKA